MKHIKNLLVLIIVMLMVSVLPSNIYADNYVAYSNDAGKYEYYYSYSDALNAAKKSKIILAVDWNVDYEINISGGTYEIEMNGHSISRSNKGRIFNIGENAKLYLYGNLDSEHSFSVLDYSHKTIMHADKYTTIKSGGVITGGNADEGGAIYMDKGSYLYMQKVAIAGNIATNAGGGIYVGGEDCSIETNDALIAYNRGVYAGGAIASKSDGTRVNLRNCSIIRKNYTDQGGGAIYLAGSWFDIVSSDKSASINENYGEIGGAIDVASKTFGSNNGTISGITFDSNTCTKYGGALALWQNNTTVKGCTITRNVSNYEGGGILNYGKNTIWDTTIKYNQVQVEENNVTLEGGGIYAHAYYDITFKGKVIVSNNVRRIDDPDDVFVGNGAFWTKAYILANDLDVENSLIGIRTESSGDRLVVKNVSGYTSGSNFFLDQGNTFHLGYESKDKELWQRKNETTYTLTVDGNKKGSYKANTRNVTAAANNEVNDKVFKQWNNLGVLQLADNTLNIVSFKMPSINVNLTSEYTSPSKDFVLKVHYPSSQEDFPSSAILSYTHEGTSYEKKVSITWYSVNYNGAYQKVGKKAENNKSYVVSAQIGKSVNDNLYFLSSLNESSIRVIYDDNVETSLKSLNVDDLGTVSLITNEINRIRVTSVNEMSATVNVGTSLSDLRIAVWKKFIEGTSATLENNETVSLTKFNIKANWDVFAPMTNNDGYVVMPESGNYYSFTIVPYDYQSNLDFGDLKNIEFKVYVNDISTTNLDDEYGILLSSQQDDEDPNFTHVDYKDGHYNLTFNIETDVPVAGECLPSSLKSISAILDGEDFDLDKDYFNLNIATWYPGVITADENAIAQYDYVYHARIVFADLIDEADPEEVLDFLDVNVNNGEEGIYAWFVVESDADDLNKQLVLHIVFDKTASDPNSDNYVGLNYSLESINSLEYSDISYEDALKANNDIGLFDLPSYISINVRDIDTGELDTLGSEIVWDNSFTTKFDASNYGEQELIIKGHIANLPSYITDNDNVNKNVTLRIEVKAKQGYVPEEVIEESNNKAITCEEYMKAKDWTWSETKKACVYKVSNTGAN